MNKVEATHKSLDGRMWQIKLVLATPPSANNLTRTAVVKGRAVVYKTEIAKKWEVYAREVAYKALLRSGFQTPLLTELEAHVEITLARRGSDQHNIPKLLFDGMQTVVDKDGKASPGLYDDDSQIVKNSAELVGYNPSNPVVTVYIKEI